MCPFVKKKAERMCLCLQNHAVKGFPEDGSFTKGSLNTTISKPGPHNEAYRRVVHSLKTASMMCSAGTDLLACAATAGRGDRKY